MIGYDPEDLVANHPTMRAMQDIFLEAERRLLNNLSLDERTAELGKKTKIADLESRALSEIDGFVELIYEDYHGVKQPSLSRSTFIVNELRDLNAIDLEDIIRTSKESRGAIVFYEAEMGLGGCKSIYEAYLLDKARTIQPNIDKFRVLQGGISSMSALFQERLDDIFKDNK